MSRLKYAEEVDRQIVWTTGVIRQSGGLLPIRELMSRVCICQRHFERRFKHATGYTPKEYSRGREISSGNGCTSSGFRE